MAGEEIEVGQYKRHSAVFKGKVALESIKGQRTLNGIAGAYGVHPGQIAQWKRQLLEVYLKDYETVPAAVANLKCFRYPGMAHFDHLEWPTREHE